MLISIIWPSFWVEWGQERAVNTVNAPLWTRNRLCFLRSSTSFLLSWHKSRTRNATFLWIYNNYADCGFTYPPVANVHKGNWNSLLFIYGKVESAWHYRQADCQSRWQFVSNHQPSLFPELFKASTSKLAMVNCRVWSSNSKSVQPNKCNLLLTSRRFISGVTNMILAKFLMNPGIAVCSTPFFSKRCIKISVSRFNLCPLYALRYVEWKPSFAQTQQPLADKTQKNGFSLFRWAEILKFDAMTTRPSSSAPKILESGWIVVSSAVDHEYGLS